MTNHKRSEALIRDNIVPVITPKTKSGHIDVDAVAKLVQLHAKSLGTKALFAVGGLGRFHELSDEDRIRAATAWISANKKLGSPLRLFLGATAESSEATLENMRKYLELGADVVFFAPLYFLRPDDVAAFIEKAREEVLGPNMPLLIYNNPAFSRQEEKNIDPETLRGCSSCISAIKDSSMDHELYCKFASIEDVALYTGNESALIDAVRRQGSHGSVGGLGNVTGTAAKLARQLVALGDDEDDDPIIAKLAAKFNQENAALHRVLKKHPDIDAGDFMSAIYHFCLGEAGVVEPQEELVEMLTEEDRKFLRKEGFIPDQPMIKKEQKSSQKRDNEAGGDSFVENKKIRGDAAAQ